MVIALFKTETAFLRPVLNSCCWKLLITDGIEIAATTPMIAKVIKTSAKVKPFFQVYFQIIFHICSKM